MQEAFYGKKQLIEILLKTEDHQGPIRGKTRFLFEDSLQKIWFSIWFLWKEDLDTSADMQTYWVFADWVFPR